MDVSIDTTKSPTVLSINSELEAKVRQKAAELGIDPKEYLAQILDVKLNPEDLTKVVGPPVPHIEIGGHTKDVMSVGDSVELTSRGIIVESHLGGAPVEYSGRVDDHSYYFRSRGRIWTFTIGKSIELCVEANMTNNPLECAEFFCMGNFGDRQFDASYMPLEQAERLIALCVDSWRSSKKKAGS